VNIDWTSVFIYIVTVMGTVEELIYGLRTTDGSSLENFFSEELSKRIQRRYIFAHNLYLVF